MPGGGIGNSYDALARLTTTKLTNSSGTVLNQHQYEYDNANRRTKQTRTGGDYVDYTYDEIGQLKSAFGKESGGTTNRVHEQLAYVYDAAGNLNYRTNNALVQTFNVDSLNELTTATRSGNMTVAGATTIAATSVKVNANSGGDVDAIRYADRTFARTDVSLLNGNNSFVATAQDSLSRYATNSVTASLPSTNTFVNDSNGNLLSDGNRHFTYDDENQLVTVVVTNSTKSEFTYDGRMRRRVRKESLWANGAWRQNLEVRYIYDGNLVLQERHYDSQLSTPFPQLTVSYTHGLDLSGTMQGAGGIGGLLARTESVPNSAASSAFYHADGNGNVTAMMDMNQKLVAQYLYDPYGNMLAMSGPLAEANAYRFSSMEWHQSSGLTLYTYRSYSPELQRWLNKDPIADRGFQKIFRTADTMSQVNSLSLTFTVNMYQPFYNSPTLYYDPNGDNPLLIGTTVAVAVGWVAYELWEAYERGRHVLDPPQPQPLPHDLEHAETKIPINPSVEVFPPIEPLDRLPFNDPNCRDPKL